MSKVADLMTLSLLWLLFSIPVFTVGSANVALYYSVHKVVRKEEGKPVRTFWQAFWSNFREGSRLLGIFFFCVVLIGFLGISLYRSAGSAALTEIYILCVILGSFCVAWFHYGFCYVAIFTSPFLAVLKNSFLICLANLPMSITMTVIFFILWGLFVLHLPVSAIGLILLPGTYCWLSSLMMDRVWKKYISQKE